MYTYKFCEQEFVKRRSKANDSRKLNRWEPSK